MTPEESPPEQASVRVRRLDDRLGLAVLRAGLSARTLVTYARDHVTVRTPSRPTFADGNTLDVMATPTEAEIPQWIARFERTVAATGARHVRLRWEDVAGSNPDRTLIAAFAEPGFTVTSRTVALLDDLTSAPAPADVSISPVAAPSRQPGAANDRRWYAATVLYRYAHGEELDDFREHDARAAEWSIEVQRELAAAQRATVWVAMRYGVPVARCTLAHDRQGLAVVEDVITHPVHRRAGIATGLVQRAVHEHLARDPAARIGVAHPPRHAAERFFAGLGFREHATVFTAHRP